jgi:hypothetical protein
VLAPLKDLERLYFRSTDLGGAVPCDLVKGKDKLMILDLSDSMASGQLPDCILGVSARLARRLGGGRAGR